MMRALYVGASDVRRYDHRNFAIDIVTYEEDNWIAYVFGPGVDGKRLSPFSTWQGAIAVAKMHVDQYISSLASAPPEDEEKTKAKAKQRNAKRSRKKKKQVAA